MSRKIFAITTTLHKDPEASIMPETQVILTEPEKIYEQMKNEFDAFNEMLKVIAIQKARLNAGIIEERNAQMLLNTVDRSIQTYSQLVVKFKEMMSGAETLEKLRYVQLQNMIGTLFTSTDLPESIQFAMMNLLAPITTSDDRDVYSIQPD